MANKKTIIITGASQGLGLEISKSLLLKNYNIAICSLNKKKLNEAYKYLLKFKKKDQHIFYKTVDVSNQTEVKNFIKLSISKFGKIYGLINNAGILGPKGKFEKTNIKEWKKTLEINLYGSIHTCLSLLPHFKKNKEGKIIQLSGAGALAPMDNFTAYSASKAAVVRFADTIAEELTNYNIQINSIAAGAINTRMVDEIINAGKKNVGIGLYNKIKKQKKDGGIPFNIITDLVLYLFTKKAKFINGKIISPKWDNWKIWEKNKTLVKESDVYTLRRIKGSDRNFDIGDN